MKNPEFFLLFQDITLNHLTMHKILLLGRDSPLSKRICCHCDFFVEGGYHEGHGNPQDSANGILPILTVFYAGTFHWCKEWPTNASLLQWWKSLWC